MKASDAWQLALEFGLPILLVGGAIVGSTLKPERRRWAETWVVLPLFAVLAVAAGWLASLRHWWFALALAVAALVFVLERLVRRLRGGRRKP